MKYFRPSKWEEFQHYKQRNPPWIRLYNSLLDDYDFQQLAEGDQLATIKLWLLFSRMGKGIPFEPKWVMKRIHARKSPDLQTLLDKGFIELCDKSASKMLATCLQDASSETEAEQSRDRADTLLTERLSTSGAPSGVDKVWSAHLEARRRFYSSRNGKNPPSQPTLTPSRRKLIKRAIREHGEQKARDAGIGIFLSDFHTGKNDRSETYLSPEVAWRMPTSKKPDARDNVDQFAQLKADRKAGVRS